jgi:alpha-amylase/alpha-mannosidase (GH57 family)
VSVSFPRYLCIHGHFYQPPRENPWLEAVEVQDSAAPYHDWNERITRECYAPNSRSRLIDNEGKILGLLNNYAWMSFNFGPTLLEWLADAAPDVLKGIVEGDRLSCERRGGHGNALAQVYNHVIMPLASERDKRTQVLWGISEFTKRFGRHPEGMWLAEAAADLATLEVLASCSIRFTVLAPRQAWRWRRIGTEEWQNDGGVDPSRAYLCKLPSGNSICLFFYDGAISSQVAFERLLDNGEKFLTQMLQGFDEKRQHAQLMHIATDGESYGHHHAHGDMALAYALDKLGRESDVRLTNYGEFLEMHLPEWEVEIYDNSSWSCVHGVERWRANCGCNSGRGWQQDWRGPMREAFDTLRDRIDQLFETRGSEILRDPWQARNDYIDVILERTDGTIRRFFEKHAIAEMTEENIRSALWLLEMQRHGLLMYTSCGWFFDEISGLEATQCLRYAARALQLARHFGEDYEPEFLQFLERAPSNVPELGNGRVVWETGIRPTRFELDRVLAHHAISLIYRPREERTRVYCYDMELLDQQVHSRGPSHVAMGRLRVRSRLTWNEAETSFVVVHYGGLDFHTVLRAGDSPEEYAAFKERLFQTFADGSLADLTQLVLHDFRGENYRLDDLFTEEQRRIIEIILHDRFAEYQRTFAMLAGHDEASLSILGRLNYPIPMAIRTASAAYLDEKLRQEVMRLEAPESLAHIRQLVERGRSWGYRPDTVALGKLLTEELHVVLTELNPASDLPALVVRGGLILDAATLLDISLDTWQPQNMLLDAYSHLAEGGNVEGPLRDAFGQLAEKLKISPDLLGWRP